MTNDTATRSALQQLIEDDAVGQLWRCHSLMATFPGQTGQLRSVLQQAWDEYHLDLATSDPAAHPFVQLAAALSAESLVGC